MYKCLSNRHSSLSYEVALNVLDSLGFFLVKPSVVGTSNVLIEWSQSSRCESSLREEVYFVLLHMLGCKFKEAGLLSRPSKKLMDHLWI